MPPLLWTAGAATGWLAWPLVSIASRGRRVVDANGGRYVRRVPGRAVRVLVVGDSSAVGIGASRPEHTVAGRLGAQHPSWSIGNLARKGAHVEDVAALLERLCRRTAAGRAVRPPYDALLVHAGGNDALGHTPSDAVQSAVARIACASALLARHTVVVTGGNLALAPGLTSPWAWWFGRQGRRVRRIFLDTLPGGRITYVDLYRDAATDPTTADPARYFAADGLHPSDDGYAIWHHHIDAALAPVGDGRVADLRRQAS